MRQCFKKDNKVGTVYENLREADSLRAVIEAGVRVGVQMSE